MDDALAGGLVKPVGIGSRSGTCSVKILVHGDVVKHRITLCVVAPVEVVAQTVHVRIETIIDIALPHHLAKILSVQNLHLVGVGLQGNAGIEVDPYLAFLASLGGDDDDTICRTRTINRCRGGILQDLDALDVITVQLVHACLGRHTVDDVERVVVVQCSDTTDANSCRTRRTTIGRDVHTRNTSLHCLDGVVLVLLCQIGWRHY